MISSELLTFSMADDHTAVVTFNRPPANALSMDDLNELGENLTKMDSSDSVKVVILTSASSQFFVSGADIKELAGIKTKEEGRKFSEKGQDIINQIESAKKPFIACVEGVCLGGGFELALACHLRIAGAEARFGLPEINLGLMPGFGGSYRFAKLVGTGRAMEVMLTGKQFTAIEAKEMGVVNRVVQKGKALETSLNLAEQIQSKSALSIAAIMTTVNDPECISMEEKLKKEAKAFGSLFPTHDAQEGMKAFLEKRLPEFKDK